MNILIVQRDREIQKYLKKGLKELGYTVEICSDRDDADVYKRQIQSL